MWAAYRTVRDGYPTATRGRISKTGAARGASAGKPRTAGRKPYKPAEYPQSESVYYDKTESWDATRLVPGTKKIVFGEDFDVTPYAPPFNRWLPISGLLR